MLLSLLVKQRLHFVFTVKALTLLCFAEFYHNRSLTHSLTHFLSTYTTHTRTYTLSFVCHIFPSDTFESHIIRLLPSLQKQNKNPICTHFFAQLYQATSTSGYNLYYKYGLVNAVLLYFPSSCLSCCIVLSWPWSLCLVQSSEKLNYITGPVITN